MKFLIILLIFCVCFAYPNKISADSFHDNDTPISFAVLDHTLNAIQIKVLSNYMLKWYYGHDTNISITNRFYKDADKWFKTSSKYDSNLCWAATCSNMIASTKWADGKTEDDIFNIYTDCFTNEGSTLMGGLTWFFSGEYIFDNLPMYAQLKPDAPAIDFPFVSLPDGLLERRIFSDENSRKEDFWKGIEDSINGAYGLEIYMSNGDNDESCSLHHTLSLSGIVYDAQDPDYRTRYKAILIADSNNNYLSMSIDEATNTSLKKAEADRALFDNVYTFYRLNYTDKGYEIVSYLDYCDHSIISSLVILNDEMTYLPASIP